MSEAVEHRHRIDRWVIGGVVALAVGIGIASCVASSSRSNNPHHDLESIAQCEARIDKLLKSPSTADYDSQTKASGSNTWTVTGTVDSENSFGATVRSSYQCTVVMHESSATTTVDYLD